jgi:LysM repeat protein
MTYRISQYETMFDIAQKFGITLHELMIYNRLTATSVIYPGMMLRIPMPAMTPHPMPMPIPHPMPHPMPMPMPIAPVRPPAHRVHTVRRGDTLRGIARRFSVSVENLMFMNNLRSTRIFPGQRLRIPMAVRPLPF